LLAEDDPVAGHILQANLERWGYETYLIEDGSVAWDHYDAEPFSIVITDWMMPGLDGLDLVRRIRARESQTYTYVMLLTSRTEVSDVVEGLDAGADDYLTKPVELDELRARLRAAERIISLEQDLAARNTELAQANVRMREDLEAAANVQQALLPEKIPEFEGIRFAWRLDPCEELAGDTLNVFPLTDRYAAFYLLDVSGHGVAAALSSVTLSRVLVPVQGRGSILVRMADGEATVVPPAVLARRLNRQFERGMAHGQFFTFLYGVFDREARELHYVSAGHPGPVWLRADGALQVLDATGPPLGILPHVDIQQKTLSLSPGDRIFVYSDGLTEARPASGEQFGLPRLLQIVEQHREAPLMEMIGNVFEGVQAWSGSQAFEDDVSCLALEIPLG
jgi:sigma-B regulation protein RsbU (phosphoserine phosphatase)